MNIKNNVTFFEDVNIKGLKEIKVEETGVLNLRLKADGTINVKGEGEIAKADHAFIGNDMIIQGEGNGVDTAGTLNFVTNGIGKKIYVDMTDIELKNLYIKTSSPIDGYKITDRENIILGAYGSLNEIYRPENTRTNKRYESLNNIYKGIYSSTDENLNALRALISFNNFGNNYEENMSDDEQLKLGAGYDHPFIFNQDKDQAILYHEATGRKLTVSTSLPGAQIYSANYLDGRIGKYGIVYARRFALCIETQNLPDAINIEEDPTTILKKGEVYDEITSYKFEVIK